MQGNFSLNKLTLVWTHPSPVQELQRGSLTVLDNSFLNPGSYFQLGFGTKHLPNPQLPFLSFQTADKGASANQEKG